MENTEKKQFKPSIETNETKQFPEDLLEKRDVIVLGETAHGKHYKTILHFLDKFGSQITQVFVELPIDYQDSVDKYFTTGDTDDKLEDFFIGAEKEGKNIRGLLEVFNKVKEIGKEIKCFDSSKTKQGEYQRASKSGRYFLRGESRDEDMFVNFQRYYKQAPVKYLLIVGANHAKKGKYTEGDERLGTRLDKVFKEKCISFEMQAD